MRRRVTPDPSCTSATAQLTRASLDRRRPNLLFAVSGDGEPAGSGDRPIRPDVRADIYEGHGLSETCTGAASSSTSGAVRIRNPSTVGRPIWGTDAEIAAPADIEDRIELLRPAPGDRRGGDARDTTSSSGSSGSIREATRRSWWTAGIRSGSDLRRKDAEVAVLVDRPGRKPAIFFNSATKSTSYSSRALAGGTGLPSEVHRPGCGPVAASSARPLPSLAPP